MERDDDARKGLADNDQWDWIGLLSHGIYADVVFHHRGMATVFNGVEGIIKYLKMNPLQFPIDRDETEEDNK